MKPSQAELDAAMEKMHLLYGKMSVLPKAMADLDLDSKDFDEYYAFCVSTMNEKASPGVPWIKLGSSIGEVMAKHTSLIKLIVKERIALLMSYDGEELPANEYVRRGLCDPVRAFIKNEAHPLEKVETGRLRLISSVSMVDQIIDRLINRHINVMEIHEWRDIPSKPGMGFSPEAVRDTINYYKDKLKNPHKSDVSGYDWSVKGWMLWEENRFRLESHKDGVTNRYRRLSQHRTRCVVKSVFQLSNGCLYGQLIESLMKSGLYITGSCNSHTRTLLALLVGADNAMSMGDDCVESGAEGALEKYKSLGMKMKFYEPCVGQFEFCNHIYDVATSSAYALGIAKETMNLVHRKLALEDKRLAMLQYYDDLSGNPELPRLLAILESVGWYGQ